MNEEQRLLGRKAAELSVRSAELSEEERHEEALATMQEAVATWRALVEATDSFHRELAGALTNLAGTYLAVDQMDQGIVHARESVAMYRALVEEAPIHRAELAAALNNLSAFLGQGGDPEGARDLSLESIALYAELAETDARTYLPEVARAQANLAFAHQDLGALDDAVLVARTGVETLAGPMLGAPREEALELAPLVDALVGLYVELCDDAGQDPDEAFLEPIDDLLEELSDEVEHECGPECAQGHDHGSGHLH